MATFAAGTANIAQAAGTDFNNPQTKAYFSLAFGGHDKLASGLHYGLMLEHNNLTQFSGAPLHPITQLDFNAGGFNSMSVNGVPFARRSVQLNEEGQATSYTAFDWGLLAVGLAGVGFAVYEVTKTHASPDPTTKTTTVATSNGNVIVTTVNGIVTSVVNAATGAGIPLGSITGPVLSSICSATGAIGGLGCSSLASTDGQALAPLVERDVKHQEWLDSENGHMGDLIPVH
ncbi:MAG: hypothetical protein ACRETW_07575 [Stenotrophobium sp.]